MKKSSSRAKINIDLPSVGRTGNSKSNKRRAKKIARKVKKTNKGVIFGVIIALVAGLLLGAFVLYNVVSKNDCFEIIGSEEITLNIDEKYVEQGVKIIEFNKDISGEVIIETDMELDEQGYPKELGTYYVKYTVDSLKYGKIFSIEKIRIVNVSEPSEGGE